MTERKRILVDVHVDGTIVATTQGIAGPACLDEVDRIAGLCKAQVASSTLTSDYTRSAVPVDVDVEPSVVNRREGS
jgi:hypothetical protein